MNIKEMALTRDMLIKYKRDLSGRIEGFRPNSIPQERVDKIKSDWQKDIDQIDWLVEAINNHQI